MIVQVWIVLASGHRPYVTTTEPSPEYYESMKRQGHSLYRAEIYLSDRKIDDGLVYCPENRSGSAKGERVL